VIRRFVLLVAWVTVVWVALWGEVSPANVLSGVAVASIGVVMFPVRPAPYEHRVRVVPLVRALLEFVVSVVDGGLRVAWLVVRARSHPHSAVVQHDLADDDPLIIALMTHAIGLSPGTTVIEHDDRERRRLLVHVLDVDRLEQVHRSLARTERSIRAAFRQPSTRAT